MIDSNTVLVSGFNGFQEFERNPSADVASLVNNQTLYGLNVYGITLPVSWRDAWPLLQKELESLQPICWLGFGLAPDPFVRLETVARNEVHLMKDVNGQYPTQSSFGSILPNAPSELPTELPVKWLEKEVKRRNTDRLDNNVITTAFSDNAGGYLCNYVFYQVVHQYYNLIPYRGFIHLPSYPVFVGERFFNEEEVLNMGMFLVERVAYYINERKKAFALVG